MSETKQDGAAWFLVGPTASGKSAVAQYLAERRGQTIVSADSMNLYRGMDIGTAKPGSAERERVRYAGIDLADPSQSYSVAAWLQAVRPVFAADSEVIVAGGTGLYVKCLVEGFDPVPPANPRLRAELEALSFPALQARAQQEATELYERLPPDDRENRRRLVRILEKVQAATAPSARSWGTRGTPTLVGLRVERTLLHRRIRERVEQMYAAGLLDEARALMARPLSPTARQAIGYAEAFAVLAHEATVEEAMERTVVRTRQLAKRQMTWFRNQLQVHWIEVQEGADLSSLAAAVADAWERFGAVTVRS